jgi:hypothetical protein
MRWRKEGPQQDHLFQVQAKGTIRIPVQRKEHP